MNTKKLIIALIILTAVLTASTAYAVTPEKEEKLKKLIETWEQIQVDTCAPMTQWTKASNNSRIATCGLYILITIKDKRLRIKIIDLRRLYDHAVLLKESLEEIIFQSPQEEYNLHDMRVGATILQVMHTLGWI